MAEINLQSLVGGERKGASNVKPGYYELEILTNNWYVPERYREVEVIGHGAFGLVCSAYDSMLKRKVAIKRLAKPFDGKEFAKRTHRELTILAHMDHENIVCLIDVFTSDMEVNDFQSLYFVTPLMEIDLAKVIKAQALEESQICFFVYQMLRGLKYLHSAELIHRDLKPCNIAVNSDCELKILDFGLARVKNEEMTGYVATRWYRAPEIMLNWTKYTAAVDIWSVGCIMAEMHTQTVLFKGKNHINQIEEIMKIIGHPDEELLNKIPSDNARRYIRNLEQHPRRDLAVELDWNDEPNAVDILSQILVLDPDRRISCTKLLEHPYFASYHDPNDEPTTEVFTNHRECMEMSLEDWKKSIWDEIGNFQPKLSSIMVAPEPMDDRS